MSKYQFANIDGSITVEEYDESTYCSAKQILQVLKDAFGLFPYSFEVVQEKDFDDVFHVKCSAGDGLEDIYICGKGTTPGGRKGLTDEQRIQPKSKYLNYVYDRQSEGKKGVFLGAYLRNGQTIFCTWKVAPSDAASAETPISKQIKINSIAKAMQEGFFQQDKGHGEYACAFKPEFLYFYLRNCDWLHSGKVNGLTGYASAENENSNISSDEAVQQLHFETGIDTAFSHNRIIFGAPGTGKSYMLNCDKDALLCNGGDFERVTFHTDYSYANFVGTYKPVMVERQADLPIDPKTMEVLAVLNDDSKTAQEKYDSLYDEFKDDGLTRLPVLLGIYSDEPFKTRKQDGTYTSNDNSVERNHGRNIRKYVNLITLKEKSEDIAYEYVPGPFMRVYVNALKSARTQNPQPYLLIIEEINRANMAAVFGDIFQLLDRGNNGVSEYPIQASEDIKKYLANELGGNPDDYAKLRIPDNMFIWATMNSADQGVFPMDTAFKRRWDFTYLGIDDNESGIGGQKVILGQGEYRRVVEWNALRKAINNELLTYRLNEDKLMGPYFIPKKDLPDGDTIDSMEFSRIFKNKVIMYLFDDAAKQKRAALFGGCDEKARNQYSKICKEFDVKGVYIFCESIGNQFIDCVSEDNRE